MAVSSSKIQDIHIEDKDIWAQFQTKYKAGDYAGAWQLIADTQFGNKKDVASIWNQIAADLVYVQGLDDPDFGSGKIRVSATVPDDIKDGEVWFQLTNEADGLITIQQCTSATNKTNDTLYPKTMATNVLGGSDMTLYPIAPKNADAAISKLADGLYDVSMSKGSKVVWNVGTANEDIYNGTINDTYSGRLVYQNNLFLLSANGSRQTLNVSSDGLNYTETNSPSFYFYNKEYVLIAGGGYFFCLGMDSLVPSSSNTISLYRSTNGELWTKVSDVGQNDGIIGYQLYFVNNYVVCIKSNTTTARILYSDDLGSTWKTIPGDPFQVDSDVLAYVPHNIIYGNNRYMCTFSVLDYSTNSWSTKMFYTDLLSSFWNAGGAVDGLYNVLSGDGQDKVCLASKSSFSNFILVGNYNSTSLSQFVQETILGINIKYVVYGLGYWWAFSATADNAGNMFFYQGTPQSGWLQYSTGVKYAEDTQSSPITMAAVDESDEILSFAKQTPLRIIANRVVKDTKTTHTLTFTNAKGNTLLSAQID